jgi:hypothetical protein
MADPKPVQRRFKNMVDLTGIGGPKVEWESALWPKQDNLMAATGRFNCFGGARGPGKMLSLETMIATPTGWKEMGSLRVGDELFDEAGEVIQVLALHPVDESPESYRLIFDDGATVDACADHLWRTFTKAERAALHRRSPEYREKRRASRPPRATKPLSEAKRLALVANGARASAAALKDAPQGSIRTTREIAETLRAQDGREVNHSIRLTAPLQLPEADLPLDPYVLGIWLGDGTSSTGVVTKGYGDMQEIALSLRLAGWQTRPHSDSITHRIIGLTERLREMNLLRNKHIPPAYLRASAPQRLALLQGLMDTDGHCSPRDGSCEFSTTLPALATATHELIMSLGHKAVLSEGRSTLYGKDCGPKFRIVWTPNANLPPVFRLKRKAAHLRKDTRQTQEFRYIVGCERIDPVPMRCITVSGRSSLYLCGQNFIPTHNTYALAEKGIQRMNRWPGIPILVLRKDLKDLKRTTMQKYLDLLPKELYDPKWGGQLHKGENWLRLYNGSVAHFGELKDWESYKSMTVGYIQIDEANEVEEEAFINLIPTLRWMTDKGVCKREECVALGAEFAREHHEHPPYQIDLCTNPAPGWIKDRFWEPWKNGHERPQHRFISATAFDNPSLPPTFISDLLEHNTPQWVQNFVYGDWASFENMVWPSFARHIHLWKGRVPHEAFVNVEGGIDYGGTTQEAHRTAAYLTGELPNGQFITFWEYSKQGAASEDFFAQISMATKQYHVHGWDADSSQHRANELLRRGGVPVFDSDRSKGAVRDGINQVHRMLTPVNPNEKRPQLYISEECPRLMGGIETYQLDPDTGEPKKNQPDDECFTAATEVLTLNGWRSLAEVADDDYVMAVTDTGSVKWELPKAIIHKPYRGVGFQARSPHLKFTATAGHEHGAMTQFDWKVRKRFRLQRKAVPELPAESYWANAPRYWPEGTGLFRQGSDEAWMAGFWVAEGCRDSGRPSFIIVDQTKDPQKEEIRTRARRLGWDWSETLNRKWPNHVRFIFSAQRERAEEWEEMFGRRAAGKMLSPELINAMTEVERQEFWEGYMAGDGARTGNQWTYSTVSKLLADGMQALSLALGYGCGVSEPPSLVAGTVVTSTSGTYARRQSFRGNIRRRKPVAHVARSDFAGVELNEMVHCVQTSTGYFMARTDGEPFVAGNCNAWRYNVMRVTRLRSSGGSFTLGTHPAGAPKKVKPSSMLEAAREQRRAVVRRLVEQADRDLPKEVAGRRGR